MWKDQLGRLLRLRAEQIRSQKIAEIDAIVDFSIAKLPLKIRSMSVADFAKVKNDDALWTSDEYGKAPTRRREYQTQTPTYTAKKRSREDFENEQLTSKIRTQINLESQHIILPATSEYIGMPPPKKQQIVTILNAIISTYESIEDEDPSVAN